MDFGIARSVHSRGITGSGHDRHPIHVSNRPRRRSTRGRHLFKESSSMMVTGSPSPAKRPQRGHQAEIHLRIQEINSSFGEPQPGSQKCQEKSGQRYGSAELLARRRRSKALAATGESSPAETHHREITKFSLKS
jgi:hypothetical protein